ncbi:MAG: ribulose-phosphate 3-epimerase, partial [Sedimentisphaerales bacterium]|nr:ribulose-phosphate 3-epimerase [Sedimentisphaerales bacterium]
PLIKAMKTPLLKDVHLMIDEPLDKVESYLAAGADMITVHAESGMHIHQTLQSLGKMANANHSDRGVLRGLALNPGTPIEVIEPVIDELEMVFLLAVNPGFAGQKFIPSTEQRIIKLKKLIREAGKDVLIGVDGGIKKDNIADVVAMGPDIIVTGSAVFDGKTPLENAKYMIETVDNAAKTCNKEDS